MDINAQLLRQLGKLHLDSQHPPREAEQWQAFLELVNGTYADSQQTVYLLERSMSISAREMSELNKMFENAQHIMLMSHWSYEKVTERMIWSREIGFLLGLEDSSGDLSFEELNQRIHDNDKDLFHENIQKALDNKQDFNCELRVQHTNGEFRWFKWITNVEQDANGSVSLLHGVIIDITQQKKTSEEINELNQKLLLTAQKSKLSSGVATSMLSSVSNVLHSINQSVDILKKDLNTPEFSNCPISPHIHNLELNIQYIKDILEMGRTMNGSSDLEERYFLPELIDNALHLSNAQELEEKRIELIKTYDFTPFVRTNKLKLLQVLVHIIQNALSALAASRLNLHKKLQISITEALEKQFVLISIQDNGVGISGEHLQRIFTPGFTTKKNGGGFSLFSCLFAVKEQGGSLEAQSEGQGKGATFKLFLPLNQ